MKIVVNKAALENNKKRHVQLIIDMAQDAAQKGMTAFYYPIPRNQGIDTMDLIDKVEDETEDSVYGKVSWGKIKFSIRY